ncbi:MAG TPA: GIDE domain-containing protein [Verrucomicrobiae bacterium]|nr:GIDE domain-containing protein [Verrucomicrobiae bacterium]
MAGIVVGVLVLLCLFVLPLFSPKRRRFLKLTQGTPISKAAGVVSGQVVKLSGTVEANPPLLKSYLTEHDCVVYHKWAAVELLWCDPSTPGSRVGLPPGGGQTLERDDVTYVRKWVSIGGKEQMMPFHLHDDSGSVLIRPDGAIFEAVATLDKRCSKKDPFYYAKVPPSNVEPWRDCNQRAFYEWVIPVNQPLIIVGTARARTDGPGIEIAGDPLKPKEFFITARTAEELANWRMAK